MADQSIYEYNSSKEYLARLLATENISIVRSADYNTASMDLKTRTMHLPIWRTSEEVYDLMTIHEIGHARYTPAEGWHTAVCDDMVFKSYMNIIEDARIEKLIKRRFAGASHTFRDGYSRLNDDDFFGIKKHNIDVAQASFIDRINVHYKLGSLIHVPFNDEERNWLPEIENIETWDEAVSLAKRLYAYAKEKAQTDMTLELDVITMKSKGSLGNGDGSGADNDTQETRGMQASVDGVESLTDKEYRERMHNLENNAAQKGAKDQFIKLSTPNIKEWVVPAKDTNAVLSTAFAKIAGGINTATSALLAQQTIMVNTMVKEFEAKKRASSYARNQFAKSGRLDMKKLAKYQLADDIFRRNLIEHKGKNHSMVMIVDWSGSMCNQIIDTVVQTINLAVFCRKVGIPFSVQIFANQIPSFSRAKQQPQNGDYGVHNRVTMYEMLSSESNAADFKRHVANFYAIAVHQSSDWHIDKSTVYPWMDHDKVTNSPDFNTFRLNGTPLNAALFITSEYVKHFREKHKTEVTNVIVLTDGESGDNRNLWGNSNYHIFDPKTGVTYRTGNYKNDSETHMCYDIIRDRNQGRVNIIGYYISDPHSAQSTARKWSGNWDAKLKGGFYVIHKTKTFRADRFFLVSNKNITVSDEWNFDTDGYAIAGDEPYTGPAKKVVKDQKQITKDIKKSFADHSRSKRENRVILSKFIDDIAAKIV